MRFGRGEVMTCADCGTETIRRSPGQRYCAPCSTVREVARGRVKRVKSVRSTPKRQAAVDASVAQRFTIAEEVDDTHRRVYLRVPYDRCLSKNVTHSTNSNGHVYMRREAKTARDELIMRLRSVTSKHRWFEGKVWLDILVEKPNARSDAVNLVDVVCDVVKEAIGVDDRWFCIRRLDWSIVKLDPCVVIGVAQEVTEHQRCCFLCGAMRPLTTFKESNTGLLGYGRECFDCRNAAARRKRAEAVL